MSQPPPTIPIYHIVHLDRLPSILNCNGLFCDRESITRQLSGTTIGLSEIKQRRLTELTFDNYPDLYVGACVPFYFCSRSVMLYLIHRRNKELSYQGGQQQIIHLVADLYETIDWADKNNQRWVFTTSNAGSRYFSDYNDLQELNKINWQAVNTKLWNSCKEEKQAEFLIEQFFPWFLVKEIGVHSKLIENQVALALKNLNHVPVIKIVPDWYY